MFATHPGNVLSLDAAKISYIAFTVRSSIGVEDLAIEAGLGNAEPVTVTYHWWCVYYKRDDITFARAWSAGHVAETLVLLTFYRLFRTVCDAGFVISSCALTFWI